jgi:hypothetical protein
MFKISTPIGKISLAPILLCIVLIGGLFLFAKGSIDIPRLYQLVSSSSGR